MSDPQQTNPTPQQPPKQPGSNDGVDISELAKRVASLTAELERITHESDSAMENTAQPRQVDGNTSQGVVAQAPDAPTSQAPQSNPNTSEIPEAMPTVTQEPPQKTQEQKTPQHAEPEPLPATASQSLQTNQAQDQIQKEALNISLGASREGANLSSLKQRVLESSTFGSRVQPAAEEPFDPLNLTERPQAALPQDTSAPTPIKQMAPDMLPQTPPNSPAAQEQVRQQEPVPPKDPETQKQSLSQTPAQHPIGEAEQQAQDQQVDPLLTKTPEPNEAASQQEAVSKAAPPQETKEAPTTQEELPQVVPTAPQPQTPALQETPNPRPTGPAHEFFDTIEWHARNDEAAQSVARDTQPASADQQHATPNPALVEQTAPQTLQQIPTQQDLQTNQQLAPTQPPISEQVQQPDSASKAEAANVSIDTNELPTVPVDTQPPAQSQLQTAAERAIPKKTSTAHDTSVPSAPIPRDDFASLTGSDHSGVEFSQPESDEQEPQEAEDANAREALAEQQRSIHGTQPSSLKPPSAPLETKQPAPSPSTPLAQSAYASSSSISPLTGHTLQSSNSEEPIPTTLKPIRTFQDDIAQRVQTRDTSIVSVASAEQNRQNEELKQKELEAKNRKRQGSGEPTSASTYLKIGISGLFIGVSIAGLAFFAYLFLQPSDTVVVETLPEYIFSDEQTRVDVTGQSRREFMNTLLAEKEKVSLRLGAISYLYLTLTARLPEEGERINLLSSTEFFERIEAEVPGSLTRSLEPMMILGVHVFDGNPPFLIFRVNFFENAFAGMLQWEEEIQIDLAPLFGPAILIPQRPTEGTAANIGAQANLGQFTDEIVRNKEVRVLRNANDRIVLLYGFVDRNTLVITTNEFTFAEIVTRLSSRRF